MIINNS